MIPFLFFIVAITLVMHFAIHWDVRQVPRRDRYAAFNRLNRQAKLLSKAFQQFGDAVAKIGKSISQGPYQPNVKNSEGTHYRKGIYR